MCENTNTIIMLDNGGNEKLQKHFDRTAVCKSELYPKVCVLLSCMTWVDEYNLDILNISWHHVTKQ